MAKKVGKQAKKAIDVKFLDAKELAKRLNIKVDELHKAKREIVKKFQDVLARKSINNPDICVDKAGNIVLRHPFTKEVIITEVPLSSFTR